MKKNIITFLALLLAAITVNAQCNCGTKPNWFSTEIKIGSKPINKYKCGYQFTMKLSEKLIISNGGYTCTGTDCVVKYKATIYKPGGAVLQTIDPFDFASFSFIFPVAGRYKLELSAMCNNSGCTSCFYYFNVL